MNRTFNSFVHNFPTSQPDVVVTFTGLLIVNFQQNDVCKVGIHPDKNHFLRVKVDLLKQGQPMPVTSWKHDFLEGLSGKLEIDVNRPANSGISQYRLPAPLDRKAKLDQQHDPQGARARDYRWAVHPGWFHHTGDRTEFSISSSFFTNFIQLNHGLFYTAALTANEVRLFSKKRGGHEFSPPLDERLTDAGISPNSKNNQELLLHRAARVIGARISLGSQSSGVRLSWQLSDGSLFVHSIPKPAANHYYSINFDNTCRPEKNCEKIFRGKKFFSDLPVYYRDVTEPAEGIMDLATKRALVHKLNDEFPCIPTSAP